MNTLERLSYVELHFHASRNDGGWGCACVILSDFGGVLESW